MHHTNGMPAITYHGQDVIEEEIIRRIAHNGHLRKSCPPHATFIGVHDGLTTKILGFSYASPEDMLKGRAAYVWRMVAFFTSPISQHHCMPVMAEFYVCNRSEAQKMDELVDRIVDSIPKAEWNGVRRWAEVGAF